jgi:O-antigen/teichoic acid export membrane protein
MSLRRIGPAYVTNLLTAVTTILGNFWLLRVVAGEVDKSTFGAFAFVNQLSVMTGVLLLGLDAAAGIRVADALGRMDPGSAARVARQIRWFCLAIAGLTLFVSLSTAGLILALHWNGSLWSGLVATTGSSVAIGLASRGSSAVLAGSQQLVVVNLVRLSQQAVTIVGGYVLFRCGWGVVSIPAADCVSALLSWFVLARSVRMLCPWLRGIVAVSWEGFYGLLSQGLSMSVASIGAVLEYAADPFLLRWRLDDLSVVAEYSLWFRFPSYAFTLCLAWASTSLPSLATAYAAGPAAGRRLTGRVLTVEGVLTASISVGITMWLPAVVYYWLSGDYSVANAYILAGWFGFWVAARSRLTLLTNILYALNRNRTIFCWMTTLAVLKITLAAVLIPEAGMIGLAAASALACGGVALGMSLTTAAERTVPGWTPFSLAIPGGLAAAAGWIGQIVGTPSLTGTVIGIGATGMVLLFAGASLLRAVQKGRFQRRGSE